MNPDWFLKHFEEISEASDAVPRLRRFILDLAVRGKLIEHDPNDEPASELLKRIKGNRGHGSYEGKRRNQKLHLPIESDQIAPQIPANWVLARVGELLDIQYGKALPAADRSDQGSVAVYGSNGIVGYCETALAQEPAIIIGRKGSAGALNLCDGPSWTTDVAYFLIPPVFFNIRFLFVALQTLDLGSLGKGVKPGLSRSEAYQLPMVVPPLAEQHRIVAKVDELMALCDELEVAQAKRERRRDRLVAATLHGLNNGGDSTEPGVHLTFDESARFYFNHLPRLTTRPEHIQQLRQTILNLAIRGKLVPRIASEGTAEPLIEEIKATREELFAEGKVGRHAPLGPVNEDEVPFAIPPAWRWMCFGDITFCRDGERIPVSREERQRRQGPFDYYGASGIIDKIDGFLFDKPLLLIGEDGANLINRSTPIAFIARGRFWVNNHAHVLDGISEGFLRYIGLFINATDLKPYITGTAQPKMNQGKMNSIPVALPPLAEQNRIVAKVDELMALCEELESRLYTAATTRHQLLEASLREALGGDVY